MERKPGMTEQEREECEIKVPFSRLMQETDRQLPYRSRRLERRKALHWGQRKLLMSEIEFLTNFGKLCDSKKVLYIGAADGQHLPLLCQLFPEYKFIFYDKAEFHPDVKDIPNAEIHNCFFEDKTVDMYAEEKVLFISDIRIVPEGFKERGKNETLDDAEEMDPYLEEYVKRDMELQKRWHLALKPVASLMKFRLPYENGTTEYLKGDLYYQVWAPSTSTEGRIVIRGDEITAYNNTEYESKLYRFNLCTRFQPFETPIKIGEIIHSYDALGELTILSNYLKEIENKTDEELHKFLNGMEVLLTRHFGKSLEDKYEEVNERFEKRLERAKKNSTPGRGRGNRGRGGQYNKNRVENYENTRNEHQDNNSRERSSISRVIPQSKPKPKTPRSSSGVKIIGVVPRKKNVQK
jgi:hypothetical protein